LQATPLVARLQPLASMRPWLPIGLAGLWLVAGCTEQRIATVASVPGMTPPTVQGIIVAVGANGTTSFSPSTIMVTQGDTVTFDWVSGTHTVTSGAPGAPDGKFCSLPAGSVVNAMTCNSIDYAQSPPYTYAFTFDTPGNFPYFCEVHGSAMTGLVIVSASPTMPMPTPSPSPSPSPSTVTVMVGPNNTTAFVPASVDINAGDTVSWVWQSSSVSHTVTSGAPGAPDGQFCSAPGAPSVAACNSASYASSAPFSYQHTFASAGSFPYFCEVHGALMTGVINVH
jgi:plastocyanin